MAAPKYDRETIDKMTDLRERGNSYQAIANRLGMSLGAVYWHCLRLGVEKPGTPKNKTNIGPMQVKRGNHVVRRFTREEDDRIQEMAIAGKNNSEIARALGRKPNSIKGRLLTLARRDERAMALSL